MNFKISNYVLKIYTEIFCIFNVINPELMELFDSQDNINVIQDSVTYQLQKMQSVEKTTDGKEWYDELPQIIKEKFSNYLEDYKKLEMILKSEQVQVHTELNKGYYYWRLIRSACFTYRQDLVEYDKQLSLEFNLQETKAISDSDVLNNCLGILEQHVIED